MNLKAIALIILSVALVLSLSFNVYLVIFGSADIEELTALRLENNATKVERNKYLGLVESSKTDCDVKLAGAKKLWEKNQDVKDDIKNSDGGMVTFELGGVR